jgi:hypothetical protein
MSIKKYNEFKTNMIQPKIQTVYVPTDNYTLYTVKVDFGFDVVVDKKELVTFTPEKFEQFKREFGKELLEKAVDNVNVDIDEFGNVTGYDDKMKQSITSVLDNFLENNKL